MDKRRKEEENLLATVEEIMKKKGELEQTIVQGVFIGPAGSGKSSLMRRLLGEDLLQRTSTPVAEKVLQVKINQPSAAAAEIAPSSSNAKIFPWSRLSYDDEVVRLLKTLFQSCIDPQSSDKLPIGIKQDSKTVSKSQTLMQLEAVPTLPTLESQETIPQQAHLCPSDADMEDAPTYTPETPTIGTETLPNVSEFRTHQEVFKDSLHMGWSQAQKYFEGACIMYLTDTGGQLEFQELLSALVSGPSVFFLVFRLDWDLDTLFDIEYIDPNKGPSKPYRSSIILKDALLQSLASITSMGRFGYTREGMELKPLPPRVFFIGTHKDKVTKEAIDKIESDLNIAVKSTAFYREGLVQPVVSSDHPNSMRMLLTVNNLSDDDSDFESVRKAIENVIHLDEFKVRAPPQWLIFSLVLRQEVAQPVISYEQCRRLANECGITDEEELDKALLFLSRRVGLIRYFPKNVFKDLSKIVIRDPRILFNKISELIIETFIFPKVSTLYACDQFVKKGFFLQNDIEKISQKTQHLLTAKRLVNLLKYLHIIAPIHKDGEEVKFFMPCILHHAEASTEMTRDYRIPPLLVCFHCGYCPKGLFPALVAYLLNNQVESKYQWILQDNEIYKDKVFFSIRPLPYTVSMKVAPSYIEICVSNDFEDESPQSPNEVCNNVITSIQMGIDQVISDLHYIVNTGYYLAFYCNCKCRHCTTEFHGAEFDHVFDCMYSEDQSPYGFCHHCCKSVKPPNGYYFWFSKVRLNLVSSPVHNQATVSDP